MSEFQNLLDEALGECKKEIQLRRMGITGEASLQQLKEVVMPELLSLKKVKQEELPPRENRWLNSFAHAFRLWGWDMNKPTRLYVLLTKLNAAYKNL